MEPLLSRNFKKYTVLFRIIQGQIGDEYFRSGSDIANKLRIISAPEPQPDLISLFASIK